MMNKSLERNTFLKEKYLARVAQEGRTPENDTDVAAMVKLYESMNTDKHERETDPEWKKNNLEYDLRTSAYIIEKCTQEYYAQNLYAALCNNDFMKNDVWPILQGKKWSCSWRYAGGIIADIRQQGDYIDWYCSGIRDTYRDDDPIDNLTPEQIARLEISKKFVSEMVVTDEIREDLLKLGWIVVDNDSIE